MRWHSAAPQHFTGSSRGSRVVSARQATTLTLTAALKGTDPWPGGRSTRLSQGWAAAPGLRAHLREHGYIPCGTENCGSLSGWFYLTDLARTLSKDRELYDDFRISTQTSLRNTFCLFLLLVLIQKWTRDLRITNSLYKHTYYSNIDNAIDSLNKKVGI